MLDMIRMFLQEKEEGQGMVEYGLILVLVSVVAIASLTIMGGYLPDIFNAVGDALSTV